MVRKNSPFSLFEFSNFFKPLTHFDVAGDNLSASCCGLGIGIATMERWFSIEAKSFCFSIKEGFSDLRLEERRKKFVGFIFESSPCAAWLRDTVEAATQVEEDISKSYREGDKVLMVHGGYNKAGRYLEVSVYAEGGL
jgi:hypothetical protein